METAMKLLSVCIILSAFSHIGSSGAPCKIPSRFWCDNPEIALSCGVYDQCKKFEWFGLEDAEPVQLTLYYESLCPDCKHFFAHMLYPTYNKISDIMNLTLVPYGNAREQKDGDHWKFECQHGKLECEGNLIETCTIAIVKKISVYLPFINCMERSNKMPKSAAQKCAKQFPVPLQEIMNCTTSDYGNKLEHEMAVQTDALKPQHEYVPWITINGLHTEAMEKEAERNLLKLICDTYKGTKPAACTQ